MEYKVKLNWTNLKYEIDYETYKAAKVIIPTRDAQPTNAEIQAEAQSDNTTGDADFCRTKIEAALANLESRMHRYMVFAGTQEGTDELNRKTLQWVLTISYADNSRRNFNVQSLASKCHRYVVDYVLQEWAKLTMPNLVQGYFDRMNLEMADIEVMVYRKEAPELLLNDGTDDGSTSYLPEEYVGLAAVYKNGVYPIVATGPITAERVFAEKEIKDSGMTGKFITSEGNYVEATNGTIGTTLACKSISAVYNATRTAEGKTYNHYYYWNGKEMQVIPMTALSLIVKQ